MGPLMGRNRVLGCDVGSGKIAVQPNLRWAGVVEDYLTLVVFIAPSQDPAVGLIRPKPRLRGVRARASGVVIGGVPSKDALAFLEASGGSDDSGPRGGSTVFRSQGSGGVLDRLSEVPGSDISMGWVEDLGSARSGWGGRISPVNAEFLALVAADPGNQHPNGSGTLVGVPGFDFERKSLSLVC